MNKRQFLQGISKYCTIWGIQDIDSIHFWDLYHWNNVQIEYSDWNQEWYTIESLDKEDINIEYNSESIWCWLEDSNITDRYEAAAYWFEEAVRQIEEYYN